MEQEYQNQPFGSFTPQPTTQEYPSRKLMSVEELISKSWEVYKSRFWSIVGLMGILLLIRLLFIIIGLIGGFSLGIGISFLLGTGTKTISETILGGWLGLIIIFLFLVLLGAFFNTWMTASLIYLIKERENKIGIKQSLRKGWSVILSFIWIGFLVGLCVFGGSLLFIIPGIIFAVWFAFSEYILIDKGIKGSKALSKSKELVQGFFGGVLWRLFIIAAIGMLVGFLQESVEEQMAVSIIIGLITTFFLTPFATIYSFLLYENLKRIKTSLESSNAETSFSDAPKT